MFHFSGILLPGMFVLVVGCPFYVVQWFTNTIIHYKSIKLLTNCDEINYYYYYYYNRKMHAQTGKKVYVTLFFEFVRLLIYTPVE